MRGKRLFSSSAAFLLALLPAATSSARDVAWSSGTASDTLRAGRER